ncbi:hypothetical protein ES706_00049 [subsurface metagenome]|nr:nucleotidyltransferase [Hadesarchaea archaeon]
MGGGVRTSFGGDVSPNDLLRKASSEEQRAAYQANINSYFQDLLADYNNRNIEQINSHLDTIESALTSEKIGSVSLIYGGSIKKRTYVDGLSDVDILAIIDDTTLVSAPPHQVLEYFANRLKERLPNTEITIGNLAATVKFSDGHEIQVLPAISTSTGIRISNADGTDWSGVIRPDKFANKLTNVNQSISKKMVPVIKLYKAINMRLPKEDKLSGYHIESLAINAFENYQGSLSYKDMLLHLTQYASTAVMNPIEDSTGQSIHVDDYLGDPASHERKRASAAIERIAARMKSADSAASVEKWKELFGE